MGLSDAMRLAVNMARAFPATPITISQTGDWIEAVEDLERQLEQAEERADRNAAAVDAAERRARQAEEQFDELSIITQRVQEERIDALAELAEARINNRRYLERIQELAGQCDEIYEKLQQAWRDYLALEEYVKGLHELTITALGPSNVKIEHMGEAAAALNKLEPWQRKRVE